MATSERFMPVEREDVWAALARPESYGYWVVGSKQIRDIDPDWPNPGSRFHHTVGIGPLKVADHTESLACWPPHQLVMRAKARPLGTARVTLRLIARDGGTLVQMEENPDGLTALLTINPALQLLTSGRNAESLARLEELARREGTQA